MERSPDYKKSKRQPAVSCYSKLKNKISRDMSTPRIDDLPDNKLMKTVAKLRKYSNNRRKGSGNNEINTKEKLISKKINDSDLESMQYQPNPNLVDNSNYVRYEEESDSNIRVIDEKILNAHDGDFLNSKMGINLQEKLDEETCNSYFQYWENLQSKKKERPKSAIRSEENKGSNKLSMFNAIKDVRLLNKISEQSRKGILKNLKQSVKENRQCTICNALTTTSKYIGFCSLCNKFCCNKCLYANRKANNLDSRENVENFSEVVHNKTKNKCKVYLGNDKICICCMSKLLIHFDFVSVLNNNGIQSIESANQEIEDLKNEFKELCGENNYARLDIQCKEIEQLIENEENNIRNYTQSISDFQDNYDPQNVEFDDLLSKTNELDYEIKKLNNDISIMEIESESLRKAINTNGKSFNYIESSKLSKLNKSNDITPSKDLSYNYKYKDKLETSFDRNESNQVECLYQSKHIQQRIRDNNDAFHRSDLNRTSNIETTQYATSHILTKDSMAGAMTQSFYEKACGEIEDGENSKLMKESLLSKARKNKNSSTMCGNGCIIM